VEATTRGCLEAIRIIDEAISLGSLRVEEKELMWLGVLQQDINEIPNEEGKFVEMMFPELEGQIIPSEYGL
jgi:hypothetical protein